MTENELSAIMGGYFSEPEQQLERAHFQVSQYLRKTQVKRAALIHRMELTDYECGYAAALNEKIEALQSILELSFGEPPMPQYFEDSDTPYPLTIVPARYGGVYSGAKWHAWPRRPWSVPREAYGDDCTCAGWWAGTTEVVGVGETAKEAVADLVSILEEREAQ